jgi:SAM-dependent methyltransferase
MKGYSRIHEGYVHQRRTDVLARHLADLVPADASVIDVGAGDGLVTRKLADARPDLHVHATEVLLRPAEHYAVESFDGTHLEYECGAFDVVLLVDVLHHADDPFALLREAVRVTRDRVIVKDVMAEGALAARTLSLMERLANTEHGISIPKRFWTRSEWRQAFAVTSLAAIERRESLGLYPFPANLVFERRFHFIAALRV